MKVIGENECRPIRPRRRPSFLRGVRVGFIASGIPGAFQVLLELVYASTSPVGPYILVVGGLCGLVAAPMGLMMTLSRSNRALGLYVFGGGTTFVAVAVASIILANEARMVAFGRVAREAEPLVSALHRFNADNGRSPDALDELVPDYINSIPTPAVGSGLFEYFRREEKGEAPDVDPAETIALWEWCLRLRCSRGFLNWDVFVYWPSEQYPTSMYGGRVERVGRWAYVHE